MGLTLLPKMKHLLWVDVETAARVSFHSGAMKRGPSSLCSAPVPSWELIGSNGRNVQGNNLF